MPQQFNYGDRISAFSVARMFSRSETKRRLQIDSPHGPGGRERTVLFETVGDPEETRTQDSARIRGVHLVENVPHAYAEDEIVATIGARPTHLRSPTKQRPARSAPAPVSTRPAGAHSLRVVAFLEFPAQAESFRQAQIKREVRWTGGVVDRKQRSSRG